MEEFKEIANTLAEAYRLNLSSGLCNNNITVKESSIPGAGLGVFAKTNFLVDDIIEFCPSIVLDWRSRYVQIPKIKQYAYNHTCNCEDCKKHGGYVVIPSGYGMIYNSANSDEEKNARFVVLSGLKLVAFSAVKEIKAGEEILTWWGQSYFDSWCKRKPEEEKKCELS
jgi:hypothetical protein